MNRMRISIIVAALGLGVAGPVPGQTLPAHTTPAACRILLHQERVQLDEIELQLDLARFEAGATQEIFALLDGLWQSRAVQRLIYAAGKFNRDVARIDVERQQLLLKRQQSFIEQYRLLCRGAATTEDLDRAYSRYLSADCALRGNELARAETELAYVSEVLTSYEDLREHAVANRQDIIVAERNVEMARERTERSALRLRQCQAELGISAE